MSVAGDVFNFIHHVGPCALRFNVDALDVVDGISDGLSAIFQQLSGGSLLE